jgi:hypothetical protein
MANYEGRGRSNYFRVADAEAFRKFCERFDLEHITDDEAGGRVGFLCNAENGEPYELDDDGADGEERPPADWVEELTGLLVEGETVVYMHVGHEKLRYVSGVALAFNAAGESRQVSLSDIYELAKQLGPATTACEY